MNLAGPPGGARVWAARAIVAFGWSSLLFVVLARAEANRRAASPIAARLAPGEVYLRDDFTAPPGPPAWRPTEVQRVGATCLMPRRPSVEGGHLLLTVNEERVLCHGQVLRHRGDVLRSAQRIPVPFRVRARVKAAAGQGVVSAVYTYTDHLDGDHHVESDVELAGPGVNRTSIWTNLFGPSSPRGRVRSIPVGVDLADAMHEVTLDVHADHTRWALDGETIRVERHDPVDAAQGVHLNAWFSPGGFGNRDGEVPFTLEAPFEVDWIEVSALEPPS